MNKFKTTVSVLCLAGLVSSFAMADFSDSFKKTETASNGFYVQGNAGLDIAELKLHKDSTVNNIVTKDVKGLKNNKLPMFGAGIGYKFNDFLRADVNAQYRGKTIKFSNKNDATKKGEIELKTIALFVNGYIDMNNSTIFTPYATAGLGTMLVHGKIVDKRDNVVAKLKDKHGYQATFAWNTGLGTRIQLTDKVDADIGYRYVSSAKATKKTVQYKAHEILAGVAYHF